jgi:hypothetical protein
VVLELEHLEIPPQQLDVIIDDDLFELAKKVKAKKIHIHSMHSTSTKGRSRQRLPQN